MKIAVIGTGNVGSALGRQWSSKRHDVTFCVRDSSDLKKQEIAKSAHARLGSLQSATESDVVLLAIPWRAVGDVLKTVGSLAGKVLLDCTNPVSPDLTELTMGYTRSAGEEIARLVPQARVVKIFNTNGSRNMANPDYGDHKVTMLYAGDDGDANRVAAQLATDVGFEPIELGPLKCARLLEPLAMTWIILARQRGLGRDFGLDVVRRPGS